MSVVLKEYSSCLNLCDTVQMGIYDGINWHTLMELFWILKFYWYCSIYYTIFIEKVLKEGCKKKYSIKVWFSTRQGGREVSEGNKKNGRRKTMIDTYIDVFFWKKSKQPTNNTIIH